MEETRQLIVLISEKLHMQIKITCAANRESVKAFVIDAIEQKFKREKEAPNTASNTHKILEIM